MTCDLPTLLRAACANDFDKAADDPALTNALILQLLCNMSEGGVGVSDVRSGNYGGAAPTWTPASGTGIGFDTSDGTQYNYYSGVWH